jgi:hypothetical protein
MPTDSAIARGIFFDHDVLGNSNIFLPVLVKAFQTKLHRNGYALATVNGYLNVLLMLLHRAVDNLRMSLSEAARLQRLSEFYVLLAMRQVFTVR